MPNLDDLLKQSMLFTAASPKQPNTVSKAFRSPQPFPVRASELPHGLDEATVWMNPIWQFSWDPERPATFTDITIRSRGMGMDYSMPASVYERLEFREVSVTRPKGKEIDLYLDPAHMIGAWYAREGEIHPVSNALSGKASPLWQLDCRIDASMLVAFGYKLDQKQPSPLTREECEVLGDDLMPSPGTRAAGVEFTATPGAKAWACVEHTRYIVLTEMVLCREHNDFVPGGLIGFGRIQPHALVWSNEDLERAEATIVFARPKRGMRHSDAMHTTHKALVVSDTNVAHNMSGLAERPLPFADAIYDYYEDNPARTFEGKVNGDHPLQRQGEITLADARFTEARTIPSAVSRRSPLVVDDGDVVKQPRQGQFDNVHVAPRMRLVMDVPEDGRTSVVVDDALPMVFMCLHDCCHMHVRWSAVISDPIISGWKDGVPFAEPGAPAVPENQTVFASFPNEHTLKYRAVAEAPRRGDLTVFCHHGLAYAIDQWPTLEAASGVEILKTAFATHAIVAAEPFWSGRENDSWALFYFRVRYTGDRDVVRNRWNVRPRLTFDLDDCMK